LIERVTAVTLFEIIIAVIGALISFGSLAVTVANFGYKIHRAVVKLHEDLVVALAGVNSIKELHEQRHNENREEHGQLWGQVRTHEGRLDGHDGRLDGHEVRITVLEREV